MVKPEHQQAARRAFAAFDARDPEGMIAACDPEVEFMSLINEAEGLVYRGDDGIRAFFADQDEAFSTLSATLEQVESHGEHALVSGRIRAEARTSGMALDLRFVQLAWVPEGGRIRGWRFYRTREEALAALASGDVLGLGRRSELGVPPE